MNRFVLPFLAVAFCAAATPACAATYYVAPTGSDTASGALAAPWQSFAHAQAVARPGDTVYFRGGRYAYTAATTQCATRRATVAGIVLDKSGAEGQPIRYWAYPGETPVFDFSGMKDDCRVKGIEVKADWIHLKGLEITGAPQQPGNRLNHESWGVWIDASHDIFEQLDLHHNMGPGLFIKDGGWNLVLNSDSHDNRDPYTSNGDGQSADGFGAHISAGHPGNVFRGCRAWANTDDGFDLINAYSPVTIEYSWAWQHGYIPGTHTPLKDGNGNGIKAGGYSGKYVGNGVKHTVRYSVAFDNKVSGFYANHHPLALDFFNNTAFGNGIDFDMLGIAPDGAPVILGTLRNNLAYPPDPAKLKVAGADSRANSWDLGLPLTAADFDSVAMTGWDAPRKPDGSLPDLPMLRPRAGSAVLGKGVDVGLPPGGKAPNLGAFSPAGGSAAAAASAAGPRKFAFGPAPAPAGFTRVDAATLYDSARGYGLEPRAQPDGKAADGKAADAGEPYYFSVDLPEGNYDVTVTLGDDKAAGVTTIKSELRRLMLENVASAPGQTVTRTFTVNVRTPQITPSAGIAAGAVKLKAPRETTEEAWNWDRRLTLEINGAHPALRTIAITPARVPTLFLLGDSTVCDQPGEPYTSWGQMLPRFLKPGIAVANHGESGETYRDSIGRRRLDKVLSVMQPGDTLVMQFGHNDQKQIKAGNGGPFSTYKAEIKTHVDAVRAHGGIPVIVSPMERRGFDAEGRVVPSLIEYADAARQAAHELDVAFIDLNTMSKVFYTALGEEGSKAAFALPSPGHLDNTHHDAYGSYELAKMIVLGLRAAHVPAARYAIDGFAFDPAHPDPVATFAVPPSPRRNTQRPLGDESHQ